MSLRSHPAVLRTMERTRGIAERLIAVRIVEMLDRPRGPGVPRVVSVDPRGVRGRPPRRVDRPGERTAQPVRRERQFRRRAADRPRGPGCPAAEPVGLQLSVGHRFGERVHPGSAAHVPERLGSAEARPARSLAKFRLAHRSRCLSRHPRYDRALHPSRWRARAGVHRPRLRDVVVDSVPAAGRPGPGARVDSRGRDHHRCPTGGRVGVVSDRAADDPQQRVELRTDRRGVRVPVVARHRHGPARRGHDARCDHRVERQPDRPLDPGHVRSRRLATGAEAGTCRADSSVRHPRTTRRRYSGPTVRPTAAPGLAGSARDRRVAVGRSCGRRTRTGRSPHVG